MNSGNLNFLEPSGPLQACNGIALPCYCRYMPATNHVKHGKAKTADVIQLKKYIYIDTSRASKGERANSYTCNVEIGQKSAILNGIFRIQNKISRTYIAHMWCTALTVYVSGSACDCCRPL